LDITKGASKRGLILPYSSAEKYSSGFEQQIFEQININIRATTEKNKLV
jgi:hypothetical protein